jgi:signal transduction histidine kinase
MGIIGTSQILSRETDLSKIHPFSERLLASSCELLRFLNEIMGSIETSSGLFPLLNKPFSLREILENILRLYRPLAIQKQLTLSLKIDPAIPNDLIGDSVRIYRIVLELVANAMNFTKAGAVKIFANLDKREDRVVRIKLTVEDTGIGIPKDKQSDLFIRFNRLTPLCDGIYQGIGLGLSSVKQFLEDLKGEIYVESDVNKGSQFICVLPLTEQELQPEGA